MNYVYIQSNFLKTEEVQISPQNRSFRFGDGIFETIRVENGKAYNFHFHLKRLENGLKAIMLPADVLELENACNSLIERNHLQAGFLRINISRDGTSKGYLPVENTPLIVIETIDGIKPEKPHAELIISSYKAVTLIPAKTNNALTYILASLEAKEAGADNALLLSNENYVCETASGNIFWFKGDKLFTPDENLPLIPGSIRERIGALHGFTEGQFRVEDLLDADEVFMTNVKCLVLPITIIRPLDKTYTITKSQEIKKLVEDDIKSQLG